MVNLKVRSTIPKLNKKPRCTLDSDKQAERMRMYNTQAWRKLRKQKLMEQPLCECCLVMGKYVAGEHIHHKDSFLNYHGALREEKALDFDNLITLCNHCHSLYHSICEHQGLRVNHTPEEIAKIIQYYKK